MFEQLLQEVSTIFISPVLLALVVMFIYALFALGMFVVDLVNLMTGRRSVTALAGFLRSRPHATQEVLELQVLKLLEPLKIISRVAPMLGLVATLIPMGPALVAVSEGDSQGVAENMVLAFSAVIVALVSASITYVILVVRRRWLITELHDILEGRVLAVQEPSAPVVGREVSHGA